MCSASWAAPPLALGAADKLIRQVAWCTGTARCAMLADAVALGWMPPDRRGV